MIEHVAQPVLDQSLATWAALCSALAAAAGLIFSIRIQHRNTVSRNTFESLYFIRTNEHYLRNAGLVVPLLHTGQPVDSATVASMRREQGLPYTVEAPNTGQAVFFILNHHEFLAAATRAGALDVNLLHQTIRSVVIGLVRVFAPLIRALRAENPASLRNLVWLYRRFTDTRWYDAPDLGPEFPWDPRLNPEPWLARLRRRTGPLTPRRSRDRRGRSGGALRRGSGG